MGESWKHIKITTEGVGFKTFADWKAPDFFKTGSRLMSSLLFTAGAEINYNKRIEALEVFKSYRAWNQSALAGLTKKYSMRSPFRKGRATEGNCRCCTIFCTGSIYLTHLLLFGGWGGGCRRSVVADKNKIVFTRLSYKKNDRNMFFTMKVFSELCDMLLDESFLKKFLLAIGVCLGMITQMILGQQVLPPKNWLPDYPKSPNVEAMQRHGTIEVDLYRGLPQISVPLYEIKTKNFTIPISLSYPASGVKVSDVGSWVGLGWSLSGGAYIGRNVRGIPDDHTAGFISRNYFLRKPSQVNPETVDGYYFLRSTYEGSVDPRDVVLVFDNESPVGRLALARGMLIRAGSILRLPSDAKLK